MKQDILTISRVMRALVEAGFSDNINIGDPVTMAMLMQSIDEPALIDKLYNLILEQDDIREPATIMSFLLEIKLELDAFNQEIDRRKQHAIKLGIYVEDTPEELQAKQAEMKNYYVSDIYLANYRTLCKEGIDPERLNLYEAMILVEDIVCAELNKASSELLSLISADNPAFCERVQSVIKYANFYSFALDIYNDVDKAYQEIDKKRNSKK
jgi:hypothetical protein